ncbi:MAG: hypothetical protein WKF75_20115, partial [Singulisphaera sp.]
MVKSMNALPARSRVFSACYGAGLQTAMGDWALGPGYVVREPNSRGPARCSVAHPQGRGEW